MPAHGARYDICDAAAVGDLERVKALLKEQPDLAVSKDPDGYTPLRCGIKIKITGTDTAIVLIRLLSVRRVVAMPRIARVVVPGMPHHVTQRGNRRADVFFQEGDRSRYLAIVKDYAGKYGLEIWAYCLMTNHVHFVAVPASLSSLSLSFRDSHQAYAAWLNRRLGESGHLWQGRFSSSVLDDAHLWAAVRYVERNPVRAGLVARAEDWGWSSAAAHCGMRADPLLSPIRMPWPVADWKDYLRTDDEKMVQMLRRQTMTGRPSGSRDFVAHIEDLLGRVLHPQKPGPKPSEQKIRK